MYSTPRKPDFRAAAKRSRNGSSLKRKVRLASNFGIVSSLASKSAPREWALGARFFGRPQILALLDRQRRVETEDLFELVDAVDFRAHRDIGDALENEFDHDRHLMFLHQRPRLGESIFELIRAFHADRLAAEALGDRDVIDAVAGHRVSVR